MEAITYVPMSLASKIEGADLVYSLPYVDSELDDSELKKTMQELIKAEIKVMRKEAGNFRKDYLAELKVPQLPIINSDFVKNEIERVRKLGVQRVDLTKYENTVDPPEQMDDIKEWDIVIETSKINYDHSLNTLFEL